MVAAKKTVSGARRPGRAHVALRPPRGCGWAGQGVGLLARPWTRLLLHGSGCAGSRCPLDTARAGARGWAASRWQEEPRRAGPLSPFLRRGARVLSHAGSATPPG